jgi:hypothetical protein
MAETLATLKLRDINDLAVYVMQSPPFFGGRRISAVVLALGPRQ